ncbi:hypothetical protein BCR34DRAFT_210967 [Clohesyomyces aquaticus]|uniref:Uncharacterized protein n=1 Tax=Clohesyomyces aquaticus TaxID=1231657 RepID=A0A1Y1ZX10_9PLEO|nr:hypothetical protein BCR34DRAFT_210967 [Clohesyomyces aquaticus]
MGCLLFSKTLFLDSALVCEALFVGGVLLPNELLDAGLRCSDVFLYKSSALTHKNGVSLIILMMTRFDFVISPFDALLVMMEVRNLVGVE